MSSDLSFTHLFLIMGHSSMFRGEGPLNLIRTLRIISITIPWPSFWLTIDFGWLPLVLLFSFEDFELVIWTYFQIEYHVCLSIISVCDLLNRSGSIRVFTIGPILKIHMMIPIYSWFLIYCQYWIYAYPHCVKWDYTKRTLLQKFLKIFYLILIRYK